MEDSSKYSQNQILGKKIHQLYQLNQHINDSITYFELPFSPDLLTDILKSKYSEIKSSTKITPNNKHFDNSAYVKYCENELEKNNLQAQKLEEKNRKLEYDIKYLDQQILNLNQQINQYLTENNQQKSEFQLKLDSSEKQSQRLEVESIQLKNRIKDLELSNIQSIKKINSLSQQLDSTTEELENQIQKIRMERNYIRFLYSETQNSK